MKKTIIICLVISFIVITLAKVYAFVNPIADYTSPAGDKVFWVNTSGDAFIVAQDKNGHIISIAVR